MWRTSNEVREWPKPVENFSAVRQPRPRRFDSRQAARRRSPRRPRRLRLPPLRQRLLPATTPSKNSPFPLAAPRHPSRIALRSRIAGLSSWVPCSLQSISRAAMGTSIVNSSTRVAALYESRRCELHAARRDGDSDERVWYVRLTDCDHPWSGRKGSRRAV